MIEEKLAAELDSPGRIPGRADPDRLQDSTGSELLHRSPRIKPVKQETRQPPQTERFKVPQPKLFLSPHPLHRDDSRVSSQQTE